MSLKHVVILAAVYFYYVNQGACKKIVFSSRVASGLCSQRDDYFENKVIPPALMSPEQEGLTLLQTCDRWALDKCSQGNSSCESTASHRECLGAPPASKPGQKTRAYGGTAVEEDEAPWNVLLRFIASWGPSDGSKFTDKEKAENDIKGIKEFGRCTGILYNRYTIITTGTCGLRGLDFAVQGVRFVAWFARRKFAFHSSCIYKSEHNKEQTCDIHFHPEFNVSVGAESENYPLHDIAIVKFRKPLDWKKSPHVHAIKIADKNDYCSNDTSFSFYGWGHTDRDWVQGAKQNTPKPLDKWKKEQEVTRMQRLPMSPYYSANCSGLAARIINYTAYYGGSGYQDPISPEHPEEKMYFCADIVDFDYNGNKGLCGGDAGGGLVCHGSESNQEILMGMKNSWNMALENCTEYNYRETTVFMKLSNYLPWIESIAGKQKPEDLRSAVAGSTNSKGPTTEAPMLTPSTPKSQAQPVGGDSKGPTTEAPMSTPSTPKSQARPSNSTNSSSFDDPDGEFGDIAPVGGAGWGSYLNDTYHDNQTEWAYSSNYTDGSPGQQGGNSG